MFDTEFESNHVVPYIDSEVQQVVNQDTDRAVPNMKIKNDAVSQSTDVEEDQVVPNMRP